jgi:hypothetical protein
MQSMLGIGWKSAYLASAVALQIVFYGSLGVLASFAVNRAQTSGRRLLQVVIAPVAVISLALIFRSLKAGHFPPWINVAIPIVACCFGMMLGLGFLYERLKITIVAVVVLIGAALWSLLGGQSAALSASTKVHLQQLATACPNLPSGEARFGASLQAAFAPALNDSASGNAVQENRAAILAWGIAIGHPGVARIVGLNPNDDLIQRSVTACEGITLRGRSDWPKHYAMSAALAVAEHPLISDAGGLMKEQLDALTQGSGFSFGDLAADRAGVRFAQTATGSEAAAHAMQTRLRNSYISDEFFPPSIDFPENLTVEDFRKAFGRVGSASYRSEVSRIEAQLDGCASLSTRPSQ